MHLYSAFDFYLQQGRREKDGCLLETLTIMCIPKLGSGESREFRSEGGCCAVFRSMKRLIYQRTMSLQPLTLNWHSSFAAILIVM